MPRLKTIVALGRIAHEAALAALQAERPRVPFVHGAKYSIGGRVALFDSYHCSRQNTNTGRLTPPMFRTVFAKVRTHLTTFS
jgi:uracil-DNA glycosylase